MSVDKIRAWLSSENGKAVLSEMALWIQAEHDEMVFANMLMEWMRDDLYAGKLESNAHFQLVQYARSVSFEEFKETFGEDAPEKLTAIWGTPQAEKFFSSLFLIVGQQIDEYKKEFDSGPRKG